MSSGIFDWLSHTRLYTIISCLFDPLDWAGEKRIKVPEFGTVEQRSNEAAVGHDIVTPEVRLLQALTGEMKRQALQEALKLRDEEHFRKVYLLPALEAGLIEMTIPDKPRSSKQKYRLTSKGLQFLNEMKNDR